MLLLVGRGDFSFCIYLGLKLVILFLGLTESTKTEIGHMSILDHFLLVLCCIKPSLNVSQEEYRTFLRNMPHKTPQ